MHRTPRERATQRVRDCIKLWATDFLGPIHNVKERYDIYPDNTNQKWEIVRHDHLQRIRERFVWLS